MTGGHNVVVDAMNFIARLAAVIPRARTHLTRYHGVLSLPGLGGQVGEAAHAIRSKPAGVW